MNRFRLLQMILYEVIVYRLFLMRKVTFLTQSCKILASVTGIVYDLEIVSPGYI